MMMNHGLPVPSPGWRQRGCVPPGKANRLRVPLPVWVVVTVVHFIAALILTTT